MVDNNGQLCVVMQLSAPFFSRVPVHSVIENGVAFRKASDTIVEACWTMATEIGAKLGQVGYTY